MVSYSEVVRHTLGRPGQLFVELLLIMSQMGGLLTPASLTICCARMLSRAEPLAHQMAVIDCPQKACSSAGSYVLRQPDVLPMPCPGKMVPSRESMTMFELTTLPACAKASHTAEWHVRCCRLLHGLHI